MKHNPTYVEAVNCAVNDEAPPLIVSSVALAFGFGVLIFSNFTIVAQFGALAAVTMLFSIFANMLITPIIMNRVRLIGLYQILDMSIDCEVLNNSPLLRNMSDYQRRKAILISELHEFEKGELLVEQDTIGRNMYLVLSGEAEVIRKDVDESSSFAILKPGQVFGEVGYIRETERTANVFPNIVAKLNFNISYILGERLADMVSKPKNK
jgi:uncharacterized protein